MHLTALGSWSAVYRQSLNRRGPPTPGGRAPPPPPEQSVANSAEEGAEKVPMQIHGFFGGEGRAGTRMPPKNIQNSIRGMCVGARDILAPSPISTTIAQLLLIHVLVKDASLVAAIAIVHGDH